MEPENCLLLVHVRESTYSGGTFASPVAAVKVARGMLNDGARAAQLLGPDRRLIWAVMRTVR